MKVYKKETVQHINATIEECWAFFSSPRNLQKITPTTMGFNITDFDGKNMYAGQIIQYKVSPLAGLKLSWMTEITVVKDKEYFITFNSKDWYDHRRTDSSVATYPVTVGDIKITSYAYHSGATQTLPNTTQNMYYAGDCSFKFQK